jgi:hypothetical protein
MASEAGRERHILERAVRVVAEQAAAIGTPTLTTCLSASVTWRLVDH